MMGVISWPITLCRFPLVLLTLLLAYKAHGHSGVILNGFGNVNVCVYALRELTKTKFDNERARTVHNAIDFSV